MLRFVEPMKIRVGMGYDVHALVAGDVLCLGGVEIPSSLRAEGHSDADCLIHAIMDALFGAANMRDIGFHYPDTALEYKGVDSKKLLKDCVKKIREKGYSVVNVDSTVCLQSPKISGYIPLMQQCLSQILGVSLEDVSVKATTTERLGFVGKSEGISAYAVCLLQKS